MKKIVFNTFSIVMIIITCCFSVFNLFFSEKIEAKKMILSDSLMNSSIAPNFHNYLTISDEVIRGKITNINFIDVELRTGTAWDDKMLANGGLPIERYTVYTVEVTDTVIGELKKGEVIECRILGDMYTSVTKPDGNKEICIFAEKAKDFYIAVGFEHGIFEIDKNNKVYSFSNIEEFSKYDNATYETLKTSIQEKYIPILRAKMYNQIQIDK